MSQQQENQAGITLRAFVLGIILSGAFAWFTVLRENRPPNFILTGTQIPVLPYLLLAVSLCLINPLLKVVRVIRVFSRAELLVLFVMCMVSNGVASYGLASHLVPIVSGLSNRHWNNDQSRWDIYVEPYLNEDFFIEEEGTREAAIRLRDVEREWREARAVLKAAQDLERSREQFDKARKGLAEIGGLQGDPELAARRQALQRQHRLAERFLEIAKKMWEEYAREYDPEEVLATYEEKIQGLEAEKEARKAELSALKEKAFVFIDEFRKGLPEDKRAIPGFIYVPGEGLTSYTARIRRLRSGGKALGELEEADARLEETIRSGGLIDAEWYAHLRRAVELLDVIAEASEFLERKKAIDASLDGLRQQLLAEQKTLRLLRTERRYARGDEAEALAERGDEANESIKEIRESIRVLEDDLKVDIRPQLAVRERVADARDALASIRADGPLYTAGDYPELRDRLQSTMAKFNGFDVSIRRFLVGDIEWGKWFGPLLNWILIVLASYVIFMSFNVLIFHQWAHNEKLIYPLAELPLALSGGGEDQHGILPPIFKSGLFWTGFGISTFVLGWNYLAGTGIIPGVGQIRTEFLWESHVSGSIFSAWSRTYFVIIFSVIGLSFMVPARVSYSMWFCHVLCMVELLVLVWLGMGHDRSSFRAGGVNVLNFRTAQGGGALIVFASVILWKCRRYLFSAFMPRALDGLERHERMVLRISSWLFVLGSLSLVAMLTWRLRVNLFYAISLYLVVLVVTIGLVRAVTEGGIIGVQAYFNPFHLVRSVFGMNRSWTAPSLMAPMWIYLTLLFFDIKAFIAPAMANALKIRDDLRMRRLKFHGAVFAAILCALVIGVAVHLVLAYNGGADGMRPWNYQRMPIWYGFHPIKNMMVTNPVDTAGGKWWLLAGALTMVLLLSARRRLFWLPHPIGLIMFVNPLMRGFWGSIFIGWCFKVLVSKYGSKDTYRRLRCLFIGLIVGEVLVAAVGWHSFDFWWR